MGGFRRAQLRGSEELFRPTEPTPVEQDLDITVDDASRGPVVTKAPPLTGEDNGHPVPNIPNYDSRSLRLSADEIDVIAEALQHLKFPGKSPARPSVDEFERLEELRQKLLDAR